MSAFSAPRFPSMATVPSFQTMDRLHFLATGERLPPIAGDACPHPTEYYIKKTSQRQQRARAYTMLIDAARSSNMILSVKPGEVNGVHYNKILGIRGGIILFDGDQSVMTLWPDGREVVEPTPPSSEASSPRRGFRLRTPPFVAASCGGRSVSPILGVDVDDPSGEEVVVQPTPHPLPTHFVSRLRPNFRRLLSELSDEALAMELEEWSEECARAEEHIQAIQCERARRLGVGAPSAE
jgi:hypothetical protein